MTGFLDRFEPEFEKAIRWLAGSMPDASALSKPTLMHSIRVGVYLYMNGYDRDTCLAGLLHDAVEDTPLTAADIERAFGNRVAELVLANTKNDSIRGKTDKYLDMMSRCVKSGEAAAVIKAADILDNIAYFKRTMETDRLQWMLVSAEMLIHALPVDYIDPAFDRLRHHLSQDQRFAAKPEGSQTRRAA